VSMKITPKGSLLYSFKLSVGAVSFAGRDMYTNEAIASFLKESELPLEYLYYVLPEYLIENASTNIYGARILNQELICNANLIVPTFDEATNIANFLDNETAKIDALIEKQQRLIELLKEKRQAVISHAVTKGLNPNAPMKDSGVKWLGEVPAHWEIRAVSKLSEKITNGYVGPTRDILVDEGVPYIQATHIKKGKVNFDGAYFVRAAWSNQHSKSILQNDDVLIVQTGAGTGDIGLVTDAEAGFNCHALIIVQPNQDVVSGEFLSMLFQSQYGYSVLYSIRTGGMHPHLNCGEVQYVRLPVPPRVEQAEILAFISSKTKTFDALINSQNTAIELMQERRTALISAAVTGKIDVRDWQFATAPE
jgi:type I restriction enzyme, S subunit